MENRSTPTPDSLATMKCPNSCTIIRIPRTSTNATIVVTATYLPPSSIRRHAEALGARGLRRSYPLSRHRSRPGVHIHAGLDAVERAIRHTIERLGDQLGNLR